MKTLFNDPVGRVEKMVGANSRFLSTLLAQIFVGALCIILVISLHNHVMGVSLYGVVFVLFLTTIIIPIFPLYALKRLLKELKKS